NCHRRGRVFTAHCFLRSHLQYKDETWSECLPYGLAAPNKALDCPIPMTRLCSSPAVKPKKEARYCSSVFLSMQQH
ncbi:hypothetical protein ACJX0J_025568, partial [Zea mays]